MKRPVKIKQTVFFFFLFLKKTFLFAPVSQSSPRLVEGGSLQSGRLGRQGQGGEAEAEEAAAAVQEERGYQGNTE